MPQKNHKSHYRKRVLSIAIAGVLSFLALPNANAEELGIITVESTTIDDKFEHKREEPSSIGVVSGEEVDAAHTDNVHQMLQSIPGLTTTFTSGDELKLHIRGVENQRYMGEKPGVAVVIDGVPVFERTGTVNIDMDNIESIKVIKGGASYLFGEDALSGAVIITTKRGAKYEGYTVGAEAGSFGAYKGLARAGFANDDANGHVQVSRRETDGYWDDSASKADYINGKLQYYLNETSDLSVGMELSDRYKNSHGKVEGVTAAEEDPMSFDPAYDDYTNKYNVNLAKYFVTYSNDFDELSNLMLNAYSYGDDTAFFSSPTSNDNEYRYANDYQQVQNGVKAEYRTGGQGLAWMVAGEARANSYENYVSYAIDIPDNPFIPGDQSHTAGELYSNDITDEAVQAVYGEVKFNVTDPLVITLNGRYDHIAYDYEDDLNSLTLDKSFNVSSWRAGANYAVSSDMDLYGNVSTGFRAPSVAQLFSGTLSPTGGTDNNPDLEPETAINVEFGIRTKTRIFGAPSEVDATIFQIQRDDYIMSTAGQYSSTPGALTDIYDNIGGMRNRGLELAITSTPTNRFTWDLAYTYLDAKFTEYDNFNLQLGTKPYSAPPPADCATYDPATEWCIESHDLAGNSVPRVPSHHLNLTLRFKPDSFWTVSGEMDAQSSYYADELNYIKIDPRTTFNLLANYDRKAGRNVWSYFARIDNLFDKFYYNTARGSSDQNGDGVFDDEDISITVNQGRTFTTGLSVTF